MDASTAEASFLGVDVWNVDVWVWIVEARCWVLRDRAGPCIGLFWFFWVTCCTDWSPVWVMVGVVVWLGPALTKRLVVVLEGCVVSPEGVALGCGGSGLVFLPVF